MWAYLKDIFSTSSQKVRVEWEPMVLKFLPKADGKLFTMLNKLSKVRLSLLIQFLQQILPR